MAHQMAQTSVTLNDIKRHFSYLTLLTHFFGKYDTYYSLCTRIGEHTSPMTLNELEGHS